MEDAAADGWNLSFPCHALCTICRNVGRRALPGIGLGEGIFVRGQGETQVELLPQGPCNAAAVEVKALMADPSSGGTYVARVSWLTATSIVVADMVGVGVFTSL